jgi:hypothetical protein
LGVADLTFPDHKNLPAEEAEFFDVSFVASNISAAFILPEIGLCRGYNSAVSAAVHMPKTAVNEDDFLYLTRTISGWPGK